MCLFIRQLLLWKFLTEKEFFSYSCLEMFTKDKKMPFPPVLKQRVQRCDNDKPFKNKTVWKLITFVKASKGYKDTQEIFKTGAERVQRKYIYI